MSRVFWKKFLIDAGIPVNAADSYTSSFVDNRITESMIPDLTKSILIDLGITIIGDVIVILKHAVHVTQEATAEKRNYKKQSKPDKRRSSSERVDRKSRKSEPEKKVEPATVTKSEVKPAAKATIKAGHTPDKKHTQSPTKTEKPPRKVRITDQILTEERTPKELKPIVPQQDVKRLKVKKEVPAVRTVSVPSKPEPKPKRTVSSTVPRTDHVITDRPAITQLVRKVATHVKHVTSVTKPVTTAVKRETSAVKSVPTQVKQNVTSSKQLVTSSAKKHVTLKEDREERPKPVAQKAHLVKRKVETSESEDSDTSSEEQSPVTRRVYGGQVSRDNEVVSRDVTEAPSRDAEGAYHDAMYRGDLAPASPVIVRRPPADKYSSIQSASSEPVITRLLPEQPRTITRNVSGNVMRTVQTVRCVSPDSTTDTPPPKPKQTTTIILNTKGKCSVRPVSPPLDMKVDRKRKVMPRNDGKTTLTRVVQRHLDSSSPHRSPKRNKNSPPKRGDHKEIGPLKSEKYNSFRSDAEESELRSNNKFRSEDDSFDIVPDKRVQIRRKVRSRSYSGGRGGSSISRRLGSSRGPDLRKSLPARMGGVAARVFSDNRLSRSSRVSERQSTRRSSGSFRSQAKECSVFSRLGD